MAEDDDDNSFGDFSFAPNIPNDDDEWGDFVQQPKPPASPALSSNGDSVSPQSAWVKPSGALPLSLFGFNEEEDDKVDIAEDAPSSENFSPIDLYKHTSNGRDSVSVENGSSKKKNLESVVLDLDQNGINGWKFGSNVETLSKLTSDMNGKIHELDGDFGSSYHQRHNGSGSDIGSRAESVFVENELKKKKSDGLNVLNSSKSADIDGWWNVEFNVEKSPSSNLDMNGHKEESNGNVSISISEQTSTSENFDFADSYIQTSNGPDSYFRSGAYPVGIGNRYSSSWKKNMDGTNALADQNFDFFGVGNSEPSVNPLSTSTSYVNGQDDKFIGNVAKDDEYDDDDDDGWEFKDAFSEPSNPGDVNNKVDFRMNLASEGGAHASGTASGSNHMHDLFGSFNGSIDLFATPNESVDLFATSDDVVKSYQEVELTNLQPATSTLNGFVPDTNTKTAQNIEGRLDISTDALNSEYEDDFGEFTTATAETGPTEVEDSTKLYTSKGALPLSIFGDEGLNYDGSSDVQDNVLHLSAVDIRNIHPPTPVMSVNDLISSLYSQVEQSASVDNVQNPTTSDINVSEEISKSSTVDDEDYFDDNSWDFQDAYNVSSPYSNAESHLNISCKLQLNDCLDFYSKLREELYSVAKCHIKSLEESRSLACSDENATVEALDHQLQAFSKELEQVNEITEENSSQDHLSGAHHLNELAGVLLEPKFQKLELEYQVSARLLLVDKDLMSTLELLRHANSMLKILTIGTSEEQLSYISVWSDMVAVCAQELKHGAMILNRASEKNVESRLISETQGCKFILALGEIYRVVVVLGASAKLFKPWIMSCSQDSSNMYMLLEECHTVWSTSGLEETLSNLSVSIVPGAVSLVKSIKHIHDLDTCILQDYLFTEKESLCWLSMLPAEVAPGLKMVIWGEEQCFVTLANLWGNMISPNPPNVSRLHIA